MQAIVQRLLGAPEASLPPLSAFDEPWRTIFRSVTRAGSSIDALTLIASAVMDRANGPRLFQTLLDLLPAGDAFTRRPYKKNDQAHIEQKNRSVVRRLAGCDRHDPTDALARLNALYADLRLYVSFFRPSTKLVGKHREPSFRPVAKARTGSPSRAASPLPHYRGPASMLMHSGHWFAAGS